MRFLQKIIYYTCYLTYKIAVKMSHPEVQTLWYRNSFCFDYWVFLKSDIDITVILTNPTRKNIKELLYTHNSVRRFLPVIGELVVFSESHKDSILECVNTYELKRDPNLIKKYNLDKKGTHYEKIIFLHKFIISNWPKKKLIEERPDKINFYAAQVGLDRQKNLEGLIIELSSLLGVDQEQFSDEYIQELEKQMQNVVYTHVDVPNIIYALFYNKLCYIKPETILNISERNIIEQTVLWELWGAFSYQVTIPEIEFSAHFARLFDKLELLTSDEFSLKAKKLFQELIIK